MGGTLNGACSTAAFDRFGDDAQDFSGLEKDYQTLACDSWALKGLRNKGQAEFESIDATLQTVANVITSEIRKRDGDRDGVKRNAEGTEYRTTVCTQFNWIWLVFSPMRRCKRNWHAK